MQSASYLAQVELWRDFESDLRIPGNLEQREVELEALSRRLAFCEAQGVLLLNITGKLQKLLEEEAGGA